MAQIHYDSNNYIARERGNLNTLSNKNARTSNGITVMPSFHSLFITIKPRLSELMHICSFDGTFSRDVVKIPQTGQAGRQCTRS